MLITSYIYLSMTLKSLSCIYYVHTKWIEVKPWSYKVVLMLPSCTQCSGLNRSISCTCWSLCSLPVVSIMYTVDWTESLVIQGGHDAPSLLNLLCTQWIELNQCSYKVVLMLPLMPLGPEVLPAPGIRAHIAASMGPGLLPAPGFGAHYSREAGPLTTTYLLMALVHI